MALVTLGVVFAYFFRKSWGERIDELITAQAERAMSLWPNCGEADLRPSQAEPYAVLAPVLPRHPAVPGLLRVPVLRPSPQGIVEEAGVGSAHHVVSVAGVTMEP
mgnify:CR=1 FL=1